MQWTLFLVVIASFASVRTQDWIDTVPELDKEAYLGRWYTVFGNRNSWFSYGSDAVCVNVVYGVFNDSTITVFNHNLKERPDGVENYICGHAYTTEEPGKLKVQFIGRNYTADYWVVALGPINDAGLYDYAVVTSSSFERAQLFVNARDPVEFMIKYAEEVLDFLLDSGFTDVARRPIPVEHPAQCQYPPISGYC